MSIAVPRPTALRRLLGYVDLTKPRIVSLVLFTGLPALLLAARGFPEPTVFWGTLAGIALAAASAASFNHYVDRDIDRLMRRTAQRPLPSGLLPPSRDAASGPFVLARLAQIYMLTGDPGRALDTLEALLKLPGWITPALLRSDPTWSPLRAEPRFARLAGAA